MGERWMLWTLLEASTKTSSKLLQKIVGTVSTTVPHTILATMIIGIVQTVIGGLIAISRKTNLFQDWRAIGGACLFGIFAVIATGLSFMAFLYGGDMGVNTFIITLSIVPGAFIDSLYFRHHLNMRQWSGIGLAILAGYSVLGWPSFQEVAELPLWVWCSLGTMISVAVNQGITQSVSRIDPFVKNFWGGLSTVLLCILLLAALGQLGLVFERTPQMVTLWRSSVLIGFIVVAMWSFNLLSYKGGATIALKKLVLNGSYLSTTMIGGAILFDEQMTVAKIVGVCLYCLAFMIWDSGTWKFVAATLGIKVVGSTQD